MAALNNVELITALISCNRQLGLVGLQLRILNGVVSLLTTEVQNKALGAYLSEQGTASGNLDLTTATLEVLACIAFKQPISQAEIDRLFDVDKRGLVVKLRDLKLVEEFAGRRRPSALRHNGSIFAALWSHEVERIDCTSFLDDHRQQFPTSLI